MNRLAHTPTRPDAEDTPVTPEVEAKLRRRLQTFDEDAKPRARRRTSWPT